MQARVGRLYSPLSVIMVSTLTIGEFSKEPIVADTTAALRNPTIYLVLVNLFRTEVTFIGVFPFCRKQ